MTPTEREELTLKIARMDRQGYNQYEIGEAVGLSQPRVSSYLKEIRERYNRSIIQEREALVKESESTYRDIMREAWLAWEKSKRDARKHVDEEMTPVSAGKGRGGKGYNKSVDTVEGRIPAVGFLNVIRECRDAIDDLYGLKAPKKVDARVAVLDWDAVLGEVGSGPVEDVIEGKLAEMEASLPQLPHTPATTSDTTPERNGETT